MLLINRLGETQLLSKSNILKQPKNTFILKDENTQKQNYKIFRKYYSSNKQVLEHGGFSNSETSYTIFVADVPGLPTVFTAQFQSSKISEPCMLKQQNINISMYCNATE